MEQDEWKDAPLSDDDPKAIRTAINKTISITQQLDDIYHKLEKYKKAEMVIIVHPLASKFPIDIEKMDALPKLKFLGSVYLRKGMDEKDRSHIIHLIRKYEKIAYLHDAATIEASRISDIQNKKKADKRELNKLKREHARDLDRAKKWERK